MEYVTKADWLTTLLCRIVKGGNLSCMLEDMSLVTVLLLSGADIASLVVREEFEAGDAEDEAMSR